MARVEIGIIMYRPLMLNTRESAIGTPWMSHALNNHIQKS